MVERLASTRALAGLDRLAAALPDDQLALIDKDALQELAASGELSELARRARRCRRQTRDTPESERENGAAQARHAGGRRKDKGK
jgi:hypothetical protein